MRLSHLFNLVCVAIISYNMGARNQEKKDLQAMEEAIGKTLKGLKKVFEKPDKSSKEFVFRTREEAEDVLEHITTAMENYGLVTLADVKDLMGIQSSYTENKYGWTSIKGMHIKAKKVDIPTCYSNCFPKYILVLPAVSLLK